MKNEIRQGVALPIELENEVFELQGDATMLLEQDNITKALEIITRAWEKLPEPKYNTSCSNIILCDYISMLIATEKYEEAMQLCKNWIVDLETCGYRIIEMEPYVFLGEIYLYLNNIDKAKETFIRSVTLGAVKRDYSDRPELYFNIAKKKIIDNQEIAEAFSKICTQKQTRQVIVDLSDETCDQIEDLSEEGNLLFDDEKYSKAIEVWEKALKLIPEPQNSYGETFWLESSIGDAYFLQDNFSEALKHFINAKNNMETLAYENPFVMLRLGELYLETGDAEQAKEFLLRAYMFEGNEIFENEAEKYFEFLQKNVQLK